MRIFLSFTEKVPPKYQPYIPYALPVAASFFAFVVALLFLVPTVNDIFTLKGEVEADNTRAEILEGKVKILQDIDQAKLTADLSKTDVALPSDNDAAGFLATISEIAVSSGSSLEAAQLVTSGASKASEKNALDFQVIVKGNFATIKGFLTKVETARRVMVVKSVSINVGEAGRLSADLGITGYYEPTTIVTNVETALPVRGPAQEKILADLDKRTIYIPPATTPSVSGRSDPFAGF